MLRKLKPTLQAAILLALSYIALFYLSVVIFGDDYELGFASLIFFQRSSACLVI